MGTGVLGVQVKNEIEQMEESPTGFTLEPLYP
jgi:hypothetical protein